MRSKHDKYFSSDVQTGLWAKVVNPALWKSDIKMAGKLTSCVERGVTARLTEKLNWAVKCEESAARQVSVDDKMGEKGDKN